MSRQRKVFWSRFLPVVAICSVTSCTTIKVESEAAAFYLKHPSAKTEYVRMDPVSPSYLKMNCEIKNGIRVSIANYLISGAVTNHISLAQLERMKEVSEMIYEHEINQIKQIESDYLKFGGQVYFFEYQNKSSSSADCCPFETGYLLICHGDIVGKVVILKGKDYESPGNASGYRE